MEEPDGQEPQVRGTTNQATGTEPEEKDIGLAQYTMDRSQSYWAIWIGSLETKQEYTISTRDML